jgi:hypothetical protein
VKAKKYFFLLCAFVPWCEVLIQNRVSGTILAGNYPLTIEKYWLTKKEAFYES